MKKQEVFIHIGMPRTGTSFLQTKVFPKIKTIELIAPPFSQYGNAFNNLLFADDSFYDEEKIKKELSSFKGEKILISNENFLGQSLYFNHINRSIIAKRLKSIFPEATIILYLRNQLDLLKSLYAISVLWGEHKPFEDFVQTHTDSFTFNDYEKHKKVSNVNFGRYKTYQSYEHAQGYIYNHLIKLYKDLFPKVEIILYEDFEHNPIVIAQRLASIFKVTFTQDIIDLFIHKEKIHQSINAKQLKYLSKLNAFRPQTAQNTFSAKIYGALKNQILKNFKNAPAFEISEEFKIILQKYFKPHNEKLNIDYPELEINKYKKEYCID